MLTAGEQIITQSEITFRHGKEFSFGVNFYNDYNDGRVYPALICFGSLDTQDINNQFMGGGVGTDHNNPQSALSSIWSL